MYTKKEILVSDQEVTTVLAAYPASMIGIWQKASVRVPLAQTPVITSDSSFSSDR